MSDVSDWWHTAIIDMEPGRITLRGHPVEALIGNRGFAEMIWLMITGETIDGPRARLLESQPRGSRRSRAASPVHRRSTHGGDLRCWSQQRHGHRAQHAG